MDKNDIMGQDSIVLVYWEKVINLIDIVTILKLIKDVPFEDVEEQIEDYIEDVNKNVKEIIVVKEEILFEDKEVMDDFKDLIINFNIKEVFKDN